MEETLTVEEAGKTASTSQATAIQDPNELLTKLLETLQSTIEDNKKQREEIETLKKIVIEELPKQFTGQILEMAQKTQETFTQLGGIIDKLQNNNTQLATQEQPQQRTSGILETVMNLIDKATSAMGANSPTQQAGLTDMDLEILKNAKAIQLMSLRNTFKMVAKQAGVPLPDVAEHISISS